VSARNNFAARRFLFRMDGFLLASTGFWDAGVKLDPPAYPQVMAPFPAMDGGTPTFWTTNGTLGFSVLKQAAPDRIKEILRVMNWLAAPHGSQEYLLKTYGLKDVDWTPDDKGNPILNDRGRQESTIPFHYVTRAPLALYWPNTPQNTPIMHDTEKAIYPYLSFNPTDPYYSPTNASKSAGLAQDFGNKINEIVVGRQPLSALDQAVLDWRGGGGDQIRKEFEEQIATSPG
jgi:putative aldouronate transport system substrate-binding protein